MYIFLHLMNFAKFKRQDKMNDTMFEVGRKRGITHALPAINEVVDFNEELLLPVVWPTVVKHVCLPIYF